MECRNCNDSIREGRNGVAYVHATGRNAGYIECSNGYTVAEPKE